MNPLQLLPRVIWDSISNRTYQVQRKTVEAQTWENLGEPIRATNGVTSVIDYNIDRKMFLYRVREAQG